MRYAVVYERHDTKVVEVEADSPEDAMKLATSPGEGFKADSVDEVRDDDDPTPADGWYVLSCEGCGAVLLDDRTQYTTTEDDAVICMGCAAGLESESR